MKITHYRCGKIVRQLTDGDPIDTTFKSVNKAKIHVREHGFGHYPHPNFGKLRVVDKFPQRQS